jgi:hypothetical protein
MIFRERALAGVTGTLLRENGELLPLTCPDAQLWIYNPTRVIDALDESACSLRRSKSGEIMHIDRYVFKPQAVLGVEIFKITSIGVSPTFLSERFVDAWRSAGLRGLDFIQVVGEPAVGPRGRRKTAAPSAVLEKTQTAPAPTVVELSAEQRDDLVRKISAGRAMFGELGDTASASKIVETIESRIHDYRRRDAILPLQEVAALGVLYGEAIRLVTGWNWKMTVLDEKTILALVSPDEAYLHLPVRYLAGQISLQPGQQTLLLLFNMLAAGKLPPSSPRGLQIIS